MVGEILADLPKATDATSVDGSLGRVLLQQALQSGGFNIAEVQTKPLQQQQVINLGALLLYGVRSQETQQLLRQQGLSQMTISCLVDVVQSMGQDREACQLLQQLSKYRNQ